MSKYSDPNLQPDRTTSWELAIGFDPTLAAVLEKGEKLKLPDALLHSIALENCTLFDAAEKSAVDALFGLARAYLHPRAMPVQGTGKDGLRNMLFYFCRTGRPALSVFKAEIADAAEDDDEDFFLKLAGAIADRREKAQQKKPDQLKVILAGLWTEHRLWLMSDKVGYLYLSRRLELPVTSEFAYGKCKQRLNLFQHPNPPLTRIKATGELLGVDKFLKKCPILNKGWSWATPSGAQDYAREENPAKPD